MKPNIALIFGGEGCEHEISCLSANNLYECIDREKYSVIRVFISKSGEWFIEGEGGNIPTFPVFISGKSGLFSEGKIIPVDLAVPALHGELGEDGVIMGALRTAHIRFIGCEALAGAVCGDKIITKMTAEALKIPTAKWIFTDTEDTSEARALTEDSLSYPIYIKPASLGSSIGISRVDYREDFGRCYEFARALSKRILIEEAVSVECELECAYIRDSGADLYAVGKILSGGGFYDFTKKYDGSTETSADSPEKNIVARVTKMADSLRRALSVTGISRFDFFLTKSGEILFNEINTFPGMTKTSLYPRLTERLGFSKGEFINRLIDEALL